MSWGETLTGLLAAFVIATVTAPVGVSGAVFLLPVQLDVLGVPNPAVTPTNLMYNVVAGPGALLRYRSSGQLGGDLTRRLLLGTLPGVVVGAVLRVYVVPGPRVFRVVVAVVLLPLGLWLIHRSLSRVSVAASSLASRHITGLALLVGAVGGVYGIGGCSILGRSWSRAGWRSAWWRRPRWPRHS